MKVPNARIADDDSAAPHPDSHPHMSSEETSNPLHTDHDMRKDFTPRELVVSSYFASIAVGTSNSIKRQHHGTNTLLYLST